MTDFSCPSQQPVKSCLKGSDLLDMVVEMKVQDCRQKLQGSFNTNKAFSLCTILKRFFTNLKHLVKYYKRLYGLILKMYTVKMSHWYEMNPFVFSTILHIQLNYHVQPVSPFKQLQFPFSADRRIKDIIPLQLNLYRSILWKISSLFSLKNFFHCCCSRNLQITITLYGEKLEYKFINLKKKSWISHLFMTRLGF